MISLRMSGCPYLGIVTLQTLPDLDVELVNGRDTGNVRYLLQGLVLNIHHIKDEQQSRGRQQSVYSP